MSLRMKLAGSLSLLMLAACSPEPADDGATATPEPATPEPAAPEPAAADSEPAAPATRPAAMPRSEASADARVYFVTPADGATVSSPVAVEFGLEGMDVVPAGTEAEHSGHHHVLIDTGLPPLDRPIPNDANHLHFGDGSTSGELPLAAGEHTLQLLLGNHLHVPHEPAVYSERITITVE